MTIAIASVLAASVPSTSSAAVLWRNADGQWIHFPTRDFAYCLRPSVRHYGLARHFRLAMHEWERKTVLRPHGTCTNPLVIVRGRWKGYTGRSGYTWMPFPDIGHATITLNLTYLARRGLRWQKRAVACHEQGHVYGLAHSPGGCMGAGYFADATKHVSADMASLINEKYVRIH